MRGRRAQRAAALLGLVWLFGCGGGSSSDVVPRLPGDGTQNLPEPTAPAEGGEEGDPWAGRSDLIQPPDPSASARLGFPEVERFELQNGLEVLVVPDPAIPTVGMQLAVRAGRRDVALEKMGLETFAAALLTRGTRGRSAEEIAGMIRQSGAQLAASAGFDATLVSCAVPARKLGVCMELLPDVVARPAFPPEQVKSVRGELADSVTERQSDPAKLASAHMENLLFGDGHPRGRPTSRATLEAISREDLVAWHRSRFRPQNAVLAVVGDVDPAGLKKKLRRAFRRWRRRRVSSRPELEEPKVRGIKVRLVDRPGASQAQIRLGRRGVKAGGPHYHEALVASAILGEQGSRLERTARSRFGDSAAASANLDRSFGHRGALMAGARVPTANAVEGAQMLMSELGRLADPGPTEAEIEKVAARLAGAYPRRLESSLELAGAILAAEIHGLGTDFVRELGSQLGAVNRAGAREAAAARFGTDNLVLVLLGPADRIEPQLKEAGWVYETVEYGDPISEKEREQEREAAREQTEEPADPAEVKRARAVLDQALAKKGGRKRLTSIKTFQWKADATVQLPGAEIQAEIRKRFVVPDKLRLDMHLIDVGVKAVTVVDGEKAWAHEQSPNGDRVTDLPPTEVLAARAQLWRDQDFVLLRHREKGTRIRPLPDVELGGTPHHAIQLTSGGGEHRVTLLINKKTHLLAGLRYQDQGMKAEERFSDYRKVNGILIAHDRETKSPQMKLSAELEDVKIDAKVAPSIFVKPE